MQGKVGLRSNQWKGRTCGCVFLAGLMLAAGIALCQPAATTAAGRARGQNQYGNPGDKSSAKKERGLGNVSPDPEANLEAGIRLTHEAKFAQAIPYLAAARGRVASGEEFAADFDLSLCYVATGQYGNAIPILTALQKKQPGAENVLNLLAQAYVGAGEKKRALGTLKAAAAANPGDRKLYLFVADACTARREYELGVEVTSMGLRAVRNSARLHYERGVFYSNLGKEMKAEADFHVAERLGAGRTIGYMAAAQAAFLEGDMRKTIEAAREGLRGDSGNYVLLSMLGSALVRNGATPGEPEFREAMRATLQAVAEQPREPDSQVTLGRLYLMTGQTQGAIAHLEAARRLDPENRAACMLLATAYRKSGNLAKAKQMFAELARLDEARARSGRSGPRQQ